MRTTDRMALALFVALSLGLVTLPEITRDRGLLGLGMGLIALLLAISAVARRFRLASWLVHLWQALVLAGLAVAQGITVYPDSGNVMGQLAHVVRQSVLAVQTLPAPMPPHPAARWLLLLLIGLLTIIADLLVMTLATPAWGIAPLLSLYLIPALALKSDVRVWTFLAVAVGYLVILAASTINEMALWTRNISRDSARSGLSTRGVWRAVATVAVPVLAASLALGSAAPRLGELNIDAKRPRGQGPIQLQDPTIDLHRNLTNQSSRVVVTYRTDNPRGQYLRMTSLPVLDRTGWKMTSMSLASDDMPPVPGLTTIRTTRTEITTGDFSSQYLPVPYAPRKIEAPGQWATDTTSLTVVSTLTENGEATRNLEYVATSAITEPTDMTAFEQAKVGKPVDAEITAKVPTDVPQDIVKLTHQLTAKSPTPVLKAAAIQEYLRDPRNFTYSTKAPSGDGYEVMSNFLFKDKAGYCIHFASAMALMARIEGIPSRISVGFLPGTQNGDAWQVQGKNMHAWPELYFEGFGWVRFEPTSAVADAPEWSVVAGQKPSPTPTATESPSAESSPSVSDSFVPQPSDDPSASQSASGGEVSRAPFDWTPVLIGVGVASGLIGLLSIPWLVRGAIRRRRYDATGDVHDRAQALWREVRDSFADARFDWPAGSPRAKASTLVDALSDDGGEALQRLALVVERSRYAPALTELPEDTVLDARTVVDSAQNTLSGWRKFVALAWPRSLWLNLVRRDR